MKPILPNHTLFNFFTNPLLNGLDPLTQISSIQASSYVTMDLFRVYSISAAYFLNKVDLASFNKNSNYQSTYVDDIGSIRGYDSLSLSTYIATNKLTPEPAVLSVFDKAQTILSSGIDLSRVDSIYSTIFPYDNIPTYQSLNMKELARILVSTRIDETTPSSVGFTPSIFVYDTIHSYMSNIMSSAMWDDAAGNPNSITYRSHLLSTVFASGSGCDSTALSSDLDSYFGVNLGLYNRIRDLFISSVMGASDLSPVSKADILNSVSTSLSGTLLSNLKTYLVTNGSKFNTNVVNRYFTLLTDHHTSTIVNRGLATGLSSDEPESESVFLQFLESEFYTNHTNTFDNLNDIASEFSLNGVDLLNHSTYLLQHFLESIDIGISQYSSTFNTPTSLTFNGAVDNVSVSNLLQSHLATMSFLSADVTNTKLLEFAIGMEMASTIYTVLNNIILDNVQLSSLFLGVDNILTSTLDTNKNMSSRLHSFLTIVTASINHDLINSPMIVMPSYISNFKNAIDYTGSFSPAISNTPTWLTTHYASNTSTSDTISRAILVSYYTYRLNAYLDSFSLNPTKL